MSQLGSNEQPLRVAVIGAGPSGFYAVEHFLKQKDLAVQIDLYDRLPTPFGLVRGGVAPDHQKIKSVTKVYDRIAADPAVRFFGNVEIGHHITVAELGQFYHQVIFTTGAASDNRMGIPGEDLAGSHPATEFVAWYNGHPDYRHLHFDLSQEAVAVVGVGNVAMDVARILARTPDELRQTDIADYALEALSHSQVKRIYLLGRRGPLQAAFTTPEVKELGEMLDADPLVLPDEALLDELSAAELKQSSDRAQQSKVEIIQSYAGRALSKKRQVVLRFLVSPVELYGQERVTGMKLVKNILVATDLGTPRPKATDQFEDLDVGLVFRSIGYRGRPIPGIPFHEKWGVINNQSGRVVDPENSGAAVLGIYTAGWIKRGPSGVIGTNKPDSVETVNCMIEDMRAGRTLTPAHPDRAALEALIAERQPQFFSYADWQTLDALELEAGAKLGRPRVKFTSVAEMVAALGK
jgi:ferredoxin--NADP+ reductase